MTERGSDRQEDTRFRVLHLLEESPHLTQRELADALGVSLGKINYCLKALIDKGLIKIKRFNDSDNKLSYFYLLTRHGIAEKATIGARFLRRKMNEYEQLKSEIEALEKEFGNRPPAEGKVSNGRRENKVTS